MGLKWFQYQCYTVEKVVGLHQVFVVLGHLYGSTVERKLGKKVACLHGGEGNSRQVLYRRN